MPLVSSYWLSKKNGKEAWIEPIIDYTKKTIEFEVEMTAGGKAPEAPKVSRGAKFRCSVCGQIAPDQYIKDESIADRMGSRMMAIIAESNNNGRVYLSPNDEQLAISNTIKPDCLTEELPYDPRNIWCVNYGLTKYRDLFTPRQLSTLVTFSNLISEVITKQSLMLY
jgi:putative DNA methylase